MVTAVDTPEMVASASPGGVQESKHAEPLRLASSVVAADDERSG